MAFYHQDQPGRREGLVASDRHPPGRFGQALPIPVEEEKPEAERGLFLHPEHYGYPRSRGIAFARYPEAIRDRLAQQAAPNASR